MENKKKNKKYRNPVISGFYPDPSICRVGEDYYMVCSSFEYFPGIPVLHSRDLINWKTINHCIQDQNELPYEDVTDSGGVWAPTIRYSDGVFYVVATFEKVGNFIVSASDPRKEWSKPRFLEVEGIDPSLFFENGKTYISTNYSNHPEKEEITMAEIDIDSGKLCSEPRTLWRGIGGGFLEAPHLYKKGQYYYLLAAEGGTNYNHMVTVARSKRLFGSYESCLKNPILTNVHDTSKEVQCSGHADIVEDQNGNWWMVHLGIRLARRTMSHLGRETFLMPLQWVDDWPYISETKKSLIIVEGPIWALQENRKNVCVDFSNNIQEKEWIYLRNPKMENYIRTKDMLLLKPTSVSFTDKKNPTFIGIRQMDFECEVKTTIRFQPNYRESEAGAVILLSSEFYYKIGIRKSESGKEIFVYKKAEDMEQLGKASPISSDKIEIIIRSNQYMYSFFYREVLGDDKKNNEKNQEILLCTASTRFLACEISGRCFTGTLIGLFAYAKEKEENSLEVFQFQIKCIK